MKPEEFRAWRIRLKLTQEQTGKRLGQSRFTIQNWESRTTPLPDYIPDLIRIIERDLKQQKDDFPVQLAYCATNLWVSSGGEMNCVLVEDFPRNSVMLRRVQELINNNNNKLYVATVVDKENRDVIVWDQDELEKEIRSPRPRLT